MKYSFLGIVCAFLFIISCSNDDGNTPVDNGIEVSYPAIQAKFNGKIDVDNLANYANQVVPTYITKDNDPNNAITDKGATLGRVLFYDKELSTNKTVACNSCHKQKLAFTDTDVQSQGVNGVTQRHSMRLVNNKYAQETKYFWDERATDLRDQSSQPIKDHIEMGFSGEDGSLDFQGLIARLESLDYYKELFTFVYGDENITEERIQDALAQFVASIQSFDSKYDTGRATAPNDNVPFSNFTQQENMGKQLFIAPPQFNANGERTGGGVGCAGCHRPPEFDIDPNTRNNGTIGNLNGGLDFTNTKAPTLRDVVNTQGEVNSAFMHTANFESLRLAILHYNNLSAGNNPNLDPRLRPGGNPQKLNLTNNEILALESFLKTLTGSNVYVDEKWSNPFN